MKPISNKIRELLIEAKKRRETEKNISKWLKISKRSGQLFGDYTVKQAVICPHHIQVDNRF